MKKVLIFFILPLFFSCGSENRSDYLPGYSGQIGEVIVVCSKNEWKQEVGQLTRSTLESPLYGLPQEEPLFTLIQVTHNSFKNVLSTHRNVVAIEISDTVKTPVFLYKKSKYAKGQMFVSIRSRNSQEFKGLLYKNKDGLVSLFQRAELNRTIARNKKHGPKELSKKVREKFNFNLTFQKDMELRVNKENFMWVRLERERPVGGYKHQISQGVLIATIPYTSRSNFLDSVLFNLKDSINKTFILGPNEGSYMTTDYEWVPPQVSEIELAEQYVKEIRGLWKMENNFMGGPYVSVITAHPNEDRLIYLEGYVYAPQFDKREYIREVEAVIKSISF